MDFSSFFMLINARFFEKFSAMIIDTEVRNLAENLNKRAAYLWRFL